MRRDRSMPMPCWAAESDGWSCCCGAAVMVTVAVGCEDAGLPVAPIARLAPSINTAPAATPKAKVRLRRALVNLGASAGSVTSHPGGSGLIFGWGLGHHRSVGEPPDPSASRARTRTAWPGATSWRTLPGTRRRPTAPVAGLAGRYRIHPVPPTRAGSAAGSVGRRWLRADRPVRRTAPAWWPG